MLASLLSLVSYLTRTLAGSTRIELGPHGTVNLMVFSFLTSAGLAIPWSVCTESQKLPQRLAITDSVQDYHQDCQEFCAGLSLPLLRCAMLVTGLKLEPKRWGGVLTGERTIGDLVVRHLVFGLLAAVSRWSHLVSC